MALHGGDIYTYNEEYDKNPIDFSANINPFGVPKQIKDTIIDNIENLVNYPDSSCRKLKEVIALENIINIDNVVCGNGGADIIYRLVHSLKPKKALLPAPTFSEYEEALKQVDCDIMYYYMDNDFILKSDFFDMIDNVSIIVICNPNNPTGILTSKDFIKKVLNRIIGTNTILLLDECFNDMIDSPSDYSLIGDIKKYNNLFILKSLTKMYAIPSIRIGYGVCSNTQLIERVEKQGQAWSVNGIAQEVGCTAILECNEYKESSRQYIKAEREFLYSELLKLGLEVIKPTANYVFFKVKDVINLEKLLYPYGIIIRSCGNYYNLSNEYYRVAVRLHNENKLLIDMLKKVLRKG